MDTKKKLAVLFINLMIIIWTIICVFGFFTDIGDGNMKVIGIECFRYFTIDSNILMALAALLMIPFTVHSLIKKTDEPKWIILLNYIGTTAVTVTFLTVMLFLGPTQGYGIMIEGSNLYLHIIGPVLACMSFIFLQPFRLQKKEILLSVLPTFVYGTLYLVMVIIVGKNNGGWEDFYGFNLGGFWYLSYVLMNIATFGLGICLKLFHNRYVKKNELG